MVFSAPGCAENMTSAVKPARLSSIHTFNSLNWLMIGRGLEERPAGIQVANNGPDA